MADVGQKLDNEVVKISTGEWKATMPRHNPAQPIAQPMMYNLRYNPMGTTGMGTSQPYNPMGMMGMNVSGTMCNNFPPNHSTNATMEMLQKMTKNVALMQDKFQDKKVSCQ